MARKQLGAAPSAPTDADTKAYADALGVSTATASTIMRRDASGRAAVIDPAASDDIATKNYVDQRSEIWTNTLTTNTTGVPGALYYTDTSTASFTISLPTAAPAGTKITVRRASGDANPLTIAVTGGGTLDGVVNGTLVLRYLSENAELINVSGNAWAYILTVGIIPVMRWMGVWGSVTPYQLNDVVSYLGGVYVAAGANTNFQPNPVSVHWYSLTNDINRTDIAISTYTNFGSGHTNFSYQRTAGVVNIFGTINVPTIAANTNTTLCTLPVGVRPGYEVWGAVFGQPGSGAVVGFRLQISTAGVVSMYNGPAVGAASGAISINFSYPAAA